jgi:hypothetical protein
MNEIGRYTAAQINTMNNMNAVVNSPYNSLNAQLSTIPISNVPNMHMRQVYFTLF